MKDNIKTNAGRCDICGEIIDMRDSNDKLTISEYAIFDEDVKNNSDLTDQDAANAVADALEDIGDTKFDKILADVIREDLEMKVHKSCLDKTSYSMLEHP